MQWQNNIKNMIKNNNNIIKKSVDDMKNRHHQQQQHQQVHSNRHQITPKQITMTKLTQRLKTFQNGK